MVRRIYVEKKKGFDVEAQGLLEDIQQNLHAEGLTGIRVLNRYDVDGIDDSTYQRARYTVFAEPAIDTVYDEQLPEELRSATFFSVEYLPGQYDQRADSAAQCIKLMNAEADAVVKFARVIVLEGEVSDQQVETIKGYCVNPVDSQIAQAEKPETLDMETIVPEDVKIMEGFTSKSAEALEQFRKEMEFAMSPDDIKVIQDYFRDEEKREPSITELKVIDTYWSDHCRHTTFNTQLSQVNFEEGPYGRIVEKAFQEYLDMRQTVYGDREKDICLMDMASIGTKYLKKKDVLHDLDESEEINACSIKVKAKINGKDEDWLVMFKNETHNHPTEIEPFGGAATCLGGAIRDPLSGRVYVYQAMRVTGAADPRRPVEDTIPGKLPQRKITQGAASGYSSYGNQIGLATGLVDEVYDEDYAAKRMEIGAVIGAAPASHVIRKVPTSGDVIVLVGGRTGRDGCGGATGSSKEHTEESILECGAEVQKGNPPVERNIQRMFRRKEVATLIKRCNDFGAGGVSVAIGELAEGLDIDLDLVPKKYEGLDGTELAISESQERMAVVVEKDKEAEFIAYAHQENLEATTVAKVTDKGRVRMYWRGKLILDLSRAFLDTNGAKQQTAVTVKGGFDPAVLTETLSPEKALEDLNCCSKKGLIERFDSTIGAATVLMPLGGKYQLSPAQGMAAKLPVTEGDTTTATLMAYGFNPRIAKASPFHGAMCAVIDSVTKMVAMGVDYKTIRLTFQEYFEKLGQDPKRWGKPFAALLGALRVQRELEIPSIGGKDSMSGTFMDINVPPTLVSFAVATLDAEQIVSTEFKRTDSQIVYLPAKRDQNGILNFEAYRKTMDTVRNMMAEKKVLAASAISEGGLFMTLVKMAVGNKIGVDGAEIENSGLDYGGIVLELAADENLAASLKGIDYKVVGRTTDKDEIKLKGIAMSLTDIIRKWEEPLEGVFPVRAKDNAAEKIEKLSYTERNTKAPAVKAAKPRILIPAFPGTNCEMDSKRAFERAGGQADIHIIRNMTQEQLIDSIKELEAKIKESQIIMLPGGFSGGDEPDGSAKFITAVFRNPRIKEAVTDLLENRDGLMLGICNGFQALIKLGLVPEGRIVDTDENSPTLTYNRIGRHQSSLIRTRVASVKSPWMAGAEVGDVHTIAISHGEGRFIANDAVMKRIMENGQVATQYVDFDGEPTMDIAFNPNFSNMAIEAITSPDGRVLGKMGHSERIGKYVYKNVDGNKDQKIFESGVKYFK
ncbi:MAG: phosphoribosylformylglycinamidine synthase [Firmicutes bacterium]|nr:phosphoribosylformylglycinamidine synthase [Bacillota bacterium]NBI63736.1 phosphoribosylformylglycinamidine synthase [Clostridiales bacterium]